MTVKNEHPSANVRPFDFHITPYPDECSYSFLCRCAVRMPQISSNRVCHALFGSNRALSQYVFKSFQDSDLSAWTAGKTDWSMRSFSLDHSCLPYCSIMLSAEYFSLLCGSLETNSSLPRFEEMRVTRACGYNRFHGRFLRYCPECAREDLLLYGEMYWHRLPQLPGVLICPRHHTPILESNVSFTYINHRFIPASFGIKENATHSIVIPHYFEENYLRLALDSKWLLENGFTLRKTMGATTLQLLTAEEPSPASIWDEEFICHLTTTIFDSSPKDSLERKWLFRPQHPFTHLSAIETSFGCVENYYRFLL